MQGLGEQAGTPGLLVRRGFDRRRMDPQAVPLEAAAGAAHVQGGGDQQDLPDIARAQQGGHERGVLRRATGAVLDLQNLRGSAEFARQRGQRRSDRGAAGPAGSAAQDQGSGEASS